MKSSHLFTLAVFGAVKTSSAAVDLLEQFTWISVNAGDTDLSAH